jgi:hypothetical protein
LEGSIRLADSDAVSRAWHEGGELFLTDTQEIKLASDMARRREEELRLYRYAFGQSTEHPTEPWADLALEVLIGVHKCFTDVSLSEYLALAIPYSFSKIAEKLPPIVRIRMCAWQSAIMELAETVDSIDKRSK